MGKAVIISEYGAGKYRIAEEFETSRALAEIAELEAQNTTIDARLDTLTAEINSAILAVYYAAEVLRAAIVNQETEAEKREKQTQHLSAKQTLDALQATETYLGLKKAANRKKKEYLEEKTAQPAQVDAWCCDYTEGITGSVGTVELGRERTAPIIQPGGAATFSASRDGQMQPLYSSTADAVFYNASIQAGATKWRPRFRTGTASNINTTADTMTVTLTPLVIDGVDCNQSTILTNAQVTYLTCNAAAFSDGDSVVVEFTGQDWDQPKVIGFVDNPQPCEYEFGLVIEAASATESADLREVLYGTGTPTLFQGINSADMPNNWFDSDTVVSWEGPYCRNYNFMLWGLKQAPASFSRYPQIGTMEVNSNAVDSLYDIYIFANGAQVATCPAGEVVVGAAYTDFAGEKTLVTATHKTSDASLHLYWWDSVSLGWQEFTVSIPAENVYQRGNVQFSASGRKCCWISKNSTTGKVGLVELTVAENKTTAYTIDDSDYLDETIAADEYATSSTGSDKEYMVVAGDYVGETLKKAVIQYDYIRNYTTTGAGSSPFVSTQNNTKTRKILFNGKTYYLYNETETLFIDADGAPITPEGINTIQNAWDGSAARVLHLDLRFDYITLFESSNISSYSLTNSGEPTEAETRDMGSLSMDVHVYDSAGAVAFTHDLGSYVPVDNSFESTLSYPFDSSTNSINKDIAVSVMKTINHTQAALPSGEVCLSALYMEYTRNPGQAPSLYVDTHYYSYLDGGDIYVLNGLSGSKPRFLPVRTTYGPVGSLLV